MLGTKHSWSISVIEILKELKKLGHDLYILSTDGYPDDVPELKEFFNRDCEDPDIDFCYTLPGNWKSRFKKASKIKASIFNYETSIVPAEWSQDLKYLDYVLPSSKFSMDVFKSNGWDEKKLYHLPLGFDKDSFLSKEVYDLPMAKSFKFLTVAINHYRKNLDKLILAYYKSFSSKDNVSLILKTSTKLPKTKFECNVLAMIAEAQKDFKKEELPSLIILDDKIKNMPSLYNAADVFISASSSEGFGLPFLEAMAANKLIIAPRATGQLDFLSEENCIFLDMKEVFADSNMQYWRANKLAKTWAPDVQNISEKMLFAYNNFKSLRSLSSNNEDIINNFTWEQTARCLVSLHKE